MGQLSMFNYRRKLFIFHKSKLQKCSEWKCLLSTNIRSIFSSKELQPKATVSKMEIVQPECGGESSALLYFMVKNHFFCGRQQTHRCIFVRMVLSVTGCSMQRLEAGALLKMLWLRSFYSLQRAKLKK